MKSNTIGLPHRVLPERNRISRPAWPFASPARWLLTLFSAAMPAAGVVLLTAWMFSAVSPPFGAAVLWATGFIFFALAVDAAGMRALQLAASGLLVMMFAVLAAAVSPEFGVLGGFVIAGWTAAAVTRWLAR